MSPSTVSPFHETTSRVAPLSIVEREAALLAPYAMPSALSQGRRHPEPAHDYRGPFQRDRDRITHSAAFRRLSYKTQVMMGEMGDYHRTRLTHTLEVASVARTIGRTLRLNEDLIEALALAHDVGHPPFGHSGEQALDECLREFPGDEGGFCHNDQALRLFEQLERPYPAFPGLNLSHEVLMGQRTRSKRNRTRSSEADVRLLEVQVVDAADSIAYDTHDADDALELGLITLDELCETSLFREAVTRVQTRFAGLDQRQLEKAAVRELIDWQVSDLVQQTQAHLVEHEIASVHELPAERLVTPSAELMEQKLKLEAFLYERVYTHPAVMAKRRDAQGWIRQLFRYFTSHGELLPASLAEGGDSIARRVSDFLASMTDRHLQRTYRYLKETAAATLE